MTYKDIVAEVEKLPLNERWLVVDEVLRSLQRETLVAQSEAQQKQPESVPLAEL